jgi:hypothetical protein
MRERIEQIGRVLIRDFMPEPHRELPVLIVDSLDQQREEGRRRPPLLDG